MSMQNDTGRSHDCQLRKRKAVVSRPFHFTWSGLPNVYMTGIEYEECSICGRVAGIFPMLSGLLDTLTSMVVQKSSPLTPPEIKFLRKAARKKAADFAKIIGVSAEQVSRWENGHNPPEKSADKLIRLVAAGSRKQDMILSLNYRSPGKESYLLSFRHKKWSGAFSTK